jgi:iron complex outermembrane receptor protein
VGGLGYERTTLSDTETLATYTYTTSTAVTSANALQTYPANRVYNNFAPEAALLVRASNALRLHARFGTGFGTPSASAFFVTPAGVYGNNTSLQAATNWGFDLGADWSVSRYILLSATGFYEHYNNENLSQSPGAGLLSYTFNIPSSAHRGVVSGIDWHPLPNLVSGLRVRTAYQFDAQVYSNYTEQLSSGNLSPAVTATNPAPACPYTPSSLPSPFAGSTAYCVAFNRAGNRIPGVIPNNLSARLVYEKPSSRYGNFGTYLDTTYRSAFWLDNANLLSAPSATVMNFDVHYDPAPGHGLLSRTHFYFDLQNLANRTFVGSESNASDSINSAGVENPGSYLAANSTGLIYAGAPRLSIGGFRVKF